MDNFYSFQDRDQEFDYQDFARFDISYLYQRSSDSRTSGTPGQDFLAWNYDKHKDVLGFVICDGVGSSFFGNIAAKYLGNQLLNELIFDFGPALEEEYEIRQKSTQHNSEILSLIGEKIAGKLNKWKEEGNKLVYAQELPSDLAPMVRTALEQQRQYGSEAVFLCGRINFVSRKIMLVWMGDSKVQIFRSDKSQIPDTMLGGRWVNSDRWSTQKGVKGSQVNVWIENFDQLNITRVIAFSDGLASVEDDIYKFSVVKIKEEVGSLLRSPKSDDISYIDIHIKDDVQKKPDLPAPENLRIGSGGKTLQWDTTRNKFEIQISVNRSFEDKQSHYCDNTEWPLSPSQYTDNISDLFYRVRVKASDKISAWSNIVHVPPSPLPKPDEPKVQTDKIDNGNGIVSWNKVNGATHYTLVEKVNNRELYFGEELEYRFTNLPVGTYGFFVRAQNKVQRSPDGVIVRYEVSLEPEGTKAKKGDKGEEDKPSLLSTLRAAILPGHSTKQEKPLSSPNLEIADLKSEKVTGQPFELKWEPIPEALEYQILRHSNISIKTGNPTIVYEGSKTRCEDTLNNSGIYYYQARAINANQKSEPSNDLKVEVRQTADGDGGTAADTNLRAGKSKSEMGASEYSGLSGKETQAHLSSRKMSVPPDTPVMNSIGAVEVGQQYTISWSKIPTANNYELIESQIASDRHTMLKNDPIVCGLINSYSVKAGSDETIVYYRVRAINYEGKPSNWSEPVHAKIIPLKIGGKTLTASDYSNEILQAPSTPQLHLVKKAKVNLEYDISWSKIGHGETFELHVADNKIKAETGRFQIVITTRNNHYRHVQNIPGEYFYRVKAIDEKSGTASEWSVVESIEILPGKPVEAPVLSYEVINSKILLKWTYVLGAEWYELEEAEISGGFREIFYRLFSDRREIKRRTYQELKRKRPGTFKYRIKACNEDGCGPESNYITVEIAEPPPNAPEFEPCTFYGPNMDSFEISWSRPVNARGFTLFERYALSSHGNWISHEVTDSRKFFRDKEPGGYSFYVIAYNQQKINGQESKTIDVNVPLSEPRWRTWDFVNYKSESPKSNVQMIILKWDRVKWAEKYNIVIYDSEKNEVRNAIITGQDFPGYFERDSYYYCRLTAIKGNLHSVNEIKLYIDGSGHHRIIRS